MSSGFGIPCKAMLMGLLFGGSVLLSGCGSPGPEDLDKAERDIPDSAVDGRTREAKAILRVLRADRNTPQISVTVDASTSDYFQQVIANMTRIELYDCPEEFRQAYKRHILAWRMCLRNLQSQGERLSRIAGWNAVAVMNGTEPRDEQERQIFASLSEMERTYEECTRIAGLYGVRESEFRM